MTRTILVIVVCAALLPLASSAAEKADKPLPADQALQREVERFSFDGPVKQALEQFEKLAGVEIWVDWSSVGRTGVKPGAKVSLKAPKARVEQLLDLTLSQVAKEGSPLAWYIDENVVHVTTQMRVLYREWAPMMQPTTQRAVRPAPVREFKFDNTPVERVIDFLRDLSGANFSVNWASLEQAGIARDTPITLKVQNVSIARMLDLVMEQLSAGRGKFDSVYWIIDRGVVSIATGNAFNNKQIVRMYDVADLLMVIPNRPRPELASAAGPSGRNKGADSGSREHSDLFADDRGDRRTEGESAAAQRQRTEETLINVIKDAIGQEMWQPLGKGSIRIVRNKLIVSQTPLGFKLLEQAMSGP